MKKNIYLFVILLMVFSLTFSISKAEQTEWEQIGPWGGIIYTIAIDPDDPNQGYAGTAVTVYKTTNGGDSWFPSGEGIQPLWFGKIICLAINPLNSQTIYAGVTDRPTHPPFKVQKKGVFKSTNSGNSWEPTSLGGSVAIGSVNDIIVDYEKDNIIYAACDYGI